MKRVLVLFLAVLIWRGSSGFAVWNQKPAQFWTEGTLFGGQLPRPDVSTNNVQTATSTSGSPQAPSDSTGQSADSPNRLNPSSCGTVSLKPQLVPSQVGQLNSPVSSSPSGGQSVSLQQGGGSSQYTAQSTGSQRFADSSQTTSTFRFQNQAFPSSASSQLVPSRSALASQQHSYDQFISSGQIIPPVPQTQTLRPVPQVVQGSERQTQVSQASPQGVASVSATSAQQQSYDQSARGSSWVVSSGQGVSSVPQTQTLSPVAQGFQALPQGVASAPALSAQQQSYDQSAGGSRWFGSLGQGVLSSQGQNAPVSQTQTLRLVPQVVQGSGSWASQGVASVSAPSAQPQGYNQSASGSNWFVSSDQEFPLVPQNQNLRPVPQVVQGIASHTQVTQGVSGQSVPSSQDQYASVSQTQTLRPVPQVVQGSPSSSQGIASVPLAQQQSFDQSASGSRWFGSSGQGVPSTQALNAPVVQGLGPQTQGSQASHQGVASIPAPSAQQQSFDQSAGGFSWFGSLEQGVPSTQGQNSPVSQTQTLRLVPQVVPGSGPWALPQGVVGVSASPAQQQGYDSAGGSRWFGSLGQGVPSAQGLNAPVVQGSASRTQDAQASPQGVANVHVSAQQQSNEQAGRGSSWFVSSGQVVPSSQGQNVPVLQTQTLWPVPQVVQDSQASPQGVVSVPAPSAQQQSFDQSARTSSWFVPSGQGISTVPQTHALSPVVQASTPGVESVPAPSAQQQGIDQSAVGSRWFGSLGQKVSSTQGPNAPVVWGSEPQTQGSHASPQGGASVSDLLAQQQSYDQSAGGSSWFVSLGQEVPSVPQTQTLRPVPQVIQSSASQTMVSQASPQGIASVPIPSAQQQGYDQSAVGSRWFGSLGQGVPSSQGLNAPVAQVLGFQTQGSQASPQGVASVSAPTAQQQINDQLAGGSSQFVSSGQGVSSNQDQNAPVAHAQTLRLVPQVVQGLGPWASPQGVVGVSASPAQRWRYDQAASWMPSQVQGPSQSSTAVQTQLPGPTARNLANLFTTAQGTSRWNTPPQSPSSVSTQFQPSQNAAWLSQASQSLVPRKWFNVIPSEFTPSWSSGSPSAWETANNNPYASLSQVASPSADAMFQSGGLGLAFQPSAVSTTNSAAGSSSRSLTSWPPAAVVSSGPISISALPLQNTWQSTGPSQSVLQSSSSVGLPGASSNLLSSVSSRDPSSYPGTTSSFNLVPSQASDASAQRVPVNQLNFNAARTSSGSSASLPSFTNAVKG